MLKKKKTLFSARISNEIILGCELLRQNLLLCRLQGIWRSYTPCLSTGTETTIQYDYYLDHHHHQLTIHPQQGVWSLFI